eukprot:Skav221604  [mRNA]  locus=scaffold1698:785983:789264:+ [translate_table: standard]
MEETLMTHELKQDIMAYIFQASAASASTPSKEVGNESEPRSTARVDDPMPECDAPLVPRRLVFDSEDELDAEPHVKAETPPKSQMKAGSGDAELAATWFSSEWAMKHVMNPGDLYET